MKPTAMHPAAEEELDEATDYYATIDLVCLYLLTDRPV